MKQWEDNLRILESVVNSFDKDSVQYIAIEEAARAPIFLNMHEDFVTLSFSALYLHVTPPLRR